MILQVLQGLEAATNCVDDMDEWLGIFNVKLRHMREDIESVGVCPFKIVIILIVGLPIGWVLTVGHIFFFPKKYFVCVTTLFEKAT